MAAMLQMVKSPYLKGK